MSIKCRTAGFTLVEVMMSAGLSCILMAALASFAFYSSRTCASLQQYGELEAQSRLALDRITQQIRQSRSLASCTSTNLTLTDADGSSVDFVYSPKAKTLTWMRNGISRVLLQGCDSIRFDMFQRNPVSGSYDAYPTATPSTCKLIQLSWVCSRSLLGTRINSESVRSAKIVIRN